MWLVTYLGLLLAPVAGLTTALVALRLSVRRQARSWSTAWIVLAALLGASILTGVILGVEGGRTEQIGAAVGFGLLFVMAWLGALAMAVAAGVLGIVAGRRWHVRLPQALGALVLALVFVLPGINWGAAKVDATIPASPNERFPFRLYEPTYLPEGYALKNTVANDSYSGNGFWGSSDEDGPVRLVELSYGADDRDDAGKRILRPRYRLNEFSSEYGQRTADGCYDYEPHSSPDPDPTPRTFGNETVTCRQVGKLPSGQPVYLERIGPVLLASVEIEGTVLLLDHPAGAADAESQSIKILQSVQEVDKREFQDRLPAKRRNR